MPGTVDDFLSRFAGGGAIDDRQAQQYHDLFVSKSPQDSAFDTQTYNQSATEYLGKLPDDQFQQAARDAVSQVPQAERQGLLGSILGALGGAAAGGAAARGAAAGAPSGAAGGLGNIASQIGLSSTDPGQMSADDAARLMNYARTQQPDALTKTVQEKPWFVKAMGNPVVMGTLAIAAAKLIADQRRKASGG